MDVKFPFSKLQIMDEETHDEMLGSGVRELKSYQTMVDSGRAMTDTADLSSRNTSLQTSSSIRTNGSLNGIPRSALASTASSNGLSAEGHRPFRHTTSTLSDTIHEEPEKEESKAVAKPAPNLQYFPAVDDGWSEIDKAFEGSHNLDADPDVFVGKFLGPKSKKEKKALKKAAKQCAFNPGQCKKKAKTHNQCKWDVFPGIKVADPRNLQHLAVPFQKGHLADPRHLGFIATPFRSGHFADPRQLISPFRSKRKKNQELLGLETSKSQNSSSGGATMSSVDSDEKEEEKEEGVITPTGPLSVNMSSAASARSDIDPTDMEMRLTRTFGHEQLLAMENSEIEASTGQGSSSGGSKPSEASSHGSWNNAIQDGAHKPPSQNHSSKSAPIMHMVEKVKAALPDAMKYKRSSTAPELAHATSSNLKETGKLRVEKFRGITFVNEYALVRTLGKGTFGTVKLALNTQNFELYALKLLPKSRKNRRANAQGSHTADADVMREIDVMKQLDHPNIVRLHEVIDDPLNSKMLMVLEYTEGGSLFSGGKINPKKRLTELSARKYFRDVLTGLDYLHAHKIAHGDLKPDNLLLGSNGHVKIADFGSSQLTRRGEVVKRTTGTPAFMAPELCSGEAYHARVADLWALGICLYMFVYCTVPFKADSILGLYDAIRNDPLEFPDEPFVSDSLKHLITRLLDKEPETRISLVGAMHHPWVTHNGAYPLPNVQELENDEPDDRCAMLMECWPDNPACVNLGNILQAVSPLFEERVYEDGVFLAKQGEAAKCIFYIKEGSAIVYHTKNSIEDSDSDEEEDDDEESREVTDKRQRLKRQGSMLKTMYCATITASRLVSAVRDYAGGNSKMISERGPGSYVGEVQFYSKGLEATWQTCVLAKGQVKVLVLHYKDLKELIAKRPEVESDVKAIMAQRQGELLKLEMLEKLASLHRDLMKEVSLATETGHASASAVETARELLGQKNCEDFLKARTSGLSAYGGRCPYAQNDSKPAPTQNDSNSEKKSGLHDSAYLGNTSELPRVVPSKHSGVTEEQDSDFDLPPLQPRTSSVSSGRSGINEKGDSAKTLITFDAEKSPTKAANLENPTTIQAIER